MAALLTTLGWISVGVTIGWLIKRRYWLRRYARWNFGIRPPPKPFSDELLRHYEAHAEAQRGSLVKITPPPLI